MVFKNLCGIVLWTKVASALEELITVKHTAGYPDGIIIIVINALKYQFSRQNEFPCQPAKRNLDRILKLVVGKGQLIIYARLVIFKA